jgi:hypothetical protein
MGRAVPAALYAVYVTGSAGSNICLFYVSDKTVAGIDAGSGKYRGSAMRLPDGGLRGAIELTVEPGHPLLTGGVAPPGMPPVPIQLDLPPGFDQGTSTILIKTPLGPVNARFEKLMDI